MGRYIASITPENRSLVVNVARLFGIETGTTGPVSVRLDSDDFSTGDSGFVFVNGFPAEWGTPFMESYAEPFIYTFRIDPDNSSFTTGKIDVTFYLNGAPIEESPSLTLYVSDGDVVDFEEYKNEALNTRGKQDSFMLLRTNPKLTGNIKLVVDSAGDIFIDTFKASSILNSRVYRKYPVSSEGNYPHDVMTVFSRLPEGELFKTPDDTLNPHKFYKDQDKQYFTDYEYGAETNMDDLYSENMKILAPLHIGKNVPDFFCIFRYEGIYNQETYHSRVIDDAEKFNDMIMNSSVVKIFDLRSYTAAGQYMRNYARSINEFIHGSCYLQFIEQDNGKNSGNYRQGNNSWRGIDVARGIITNKIESSYFANNILESGDAVQERFNNYIINGYERNNVLYPYILNFEFMFNDESSEEFSMHRYFGLYLTSNEFLRYQCVITDYNSGNPVVRKLDDDDNDVDDSQIFASVFQQKFRDRIVFMVTNNAASRVTEEKNVKDFINDNVLDNPDGNIADVRTDDMKWRDEDRSFLTLSFPEPVKYGEHLRFIGFNIYDRNRDVYENICLEIVASNDSRLLETDDFIYPYIVTNEPGESVHADSGESSAKENASKIYRLSFYTQSLTDSSVSATVSEQIGRICACIRKFSSFVSVVSFTDDSIGIVSSEEEVYFQHILPVNKNSAPRLKKMYLTEGSSGECVINYTGHDSVHNLSYDSYVYTIRDELVKSGAVTDGVKLQLDAEAYELNDTFFSTTEIEKVSSFVEYEDSENCVTDTIRYFSRVHDTLMRPLSPDTLHYDGMFAVFSLFSFESLGWRYSNIIRFKRPAEFRNPLVVYDKLQDILKNVRHPLVKVSDGKFETMMTINVDNDYLTDNVILNLAYDDIHVHTQKIVTKEIERHTLLSPYNLNGCILDFWNRPFLHNFSLSIFNVESAQVCVMGMLGIRDIDMSINLSHADVITDSRTRELPSGTIIDMNRNEENVIRKDVLYLVEKGSFKELNVRKFIILADVIYYTTDVSSDEVMKSKFFGGVLSVASDMTLTMLDAGNHQSFSYASSEPVQRDENYFKYRDEIATSLLDIPVVPMTNCFWKSNGTYLDGTSVLNIDDLKSDYTLEGYFTEHGHSPSDELPNMTAPNSTASFFRTSGEYSMFRDAIINGTLKNAIKKMIYDGYAVDTAVGYYNSYIQSLEFIYYGIKFNLKFDAEYYNQNLRIGEYNNFDVYFINDYDSILDNEVYISADEEVILFVNHKYDVTSLYVKYTRIHSIDGDITDSVDYSVVPSPYEIMTDTICGFTNTVIAGKSNSVSIVDSSAYFIQEDYPSGVLEGNTNVLSHYIYMPISGDSGDSFNVKDDTVGISRKRSGTVRIEQFSNTPDDASDTTDYYGRASNSFIMKYEDATEEDRRTAKEKVAEYIKSMEGNLNCYVIYNNVVTSIYITENYRPLKITTKVPEKIKFNFGYFMPVFYDIITFRSDDYDFASAARVGLLMANTRVRDIRRLNSYTENKVFESTSEFSVYKNYFFDYSRSVFSANWDNGFYRKYTNNDSFALKGGYFPGIEDKSFFGSKCLVIKGDYILIDDFSSPRINPKVEYINSSYNVYSENRKRCRISINITQSIYSLFESDATFRKNWENGDGWSDVDTARGNYIQNTISAIFNTQRQREVVVYGQKTASETMYVEFSPSASGYASWNVIEDFETETVIENNNMMLVITITTEPGLTIHPQLKIYRY